MAEMQRVSGFTGRYHPSEQEVTDLLTAAKSHPLGRSFLLEGSLDSVAATFRVHAFVVDAARDRLREAEDARFPALVTSGGARSPIGATIGR